MGKNLWISIGPTGSGKSFVTEKIIHDYINNYTIHNTKNIVETKKNKIKVINTADIVTPSQDNIESCFLDDLIEKDKIYQNINKIAIKHFFGEISSLKNNFINLFYDPPNQWTNTGYKKKIYDFNKTLFDSNFSTFIKDPRFKEFFIFQQKLYFLIRQINNEKNENNLYNFFLKENIDIKNIFDFNHLYKILNIIKLIKEKINNKIDFSNFNLNMDKIRLLDRNLENSFPKFKKIIEFQESLETDKERLEFSTIPITNHTFELIKNIIDKFYIPFTSQQDYLINVYGIEDNFYIQNDKNIINYLTNTNTEHIILESTGESDLNWLFNSDVGEIITKNTDIKFKFVVPYIGELDDSDFNPNLNFLDNNDDITLNKLSKQGMYSNFFRLFKKIFKEKISKNEIIKFEINESECGKARTTNIIDFSKLESQNYYEKFKNKMIVYKNVKDFINTCYKLKCDSGLFKREGNDLNIINYIENNSYFYIVHNPIVDQSKDLKIIIKTKKNNKILLQEKIIDQIIDDTK